MRRSRGGWWVFGAVVAGALVASAGCALSSSGPLLTDNDGGVSTKQYGTSGSDARFIWTPNEVVDREAGLVWRRVAAPARTWAEAAPHCASLDMRLPTRDELLTVSDAFGTDLFPDTVERADWHWSSTPGTRADSAWAVGNAGYANANGIEAKSLVRCVTSR